MGSNVGSKVSKVGTSVSKNVGVSVSVNVGSSVGSRVGKGVPNVGNSVGVCYFRVISRAKF